MIVHFLRFYLFLVKGEGREKEREKHQCVVISHAPNWGPGPQPHMYTDWELNW